MAWKAINASLEPGPDGVLLIRGYGKDPSMLFSPSGLYIPPDFSRLEFSLKVPPTNPHGYILFKTPDGRLWRKEYVFGPPGEFNTYRINLEEFTLSKVSIDSIAFAFDPGVTVELDSVQFYKPSLYRLSHSYWKQFWKASYITGTTINSLHAPQIGRSPFLTPLYSALLLLVLCLVIILRPVTIGTVTRAIALSCIIAGLMFAVRMDYNWYMQWQRDQNLMARKSLGERLSLLGRGDAYYLAVHLKKLIPPGEKVRIYSGEDYFRVLIKYYLLPVKVSEQGNYILVCRDESISFEPSVNILRKEDKVIAKDVSLIAPLGNGNVLYKTDVRIKK